LIIESATGLYGVIFDSEKIEVESGIMLILSCCALALNILKLSIVGGHSHGGGEGHKHGSGG